MGFYLQANQTYAERVLSGEIPAGRLQRQACQRHLADVAAGKFLWDEAAAGEIVDFCGFLRHYKGEWAGRVWVPEPWQIFILTSIFGWKRADGTRRFRHAYIEIPRKNGKTFLAAAIGLYGLTLDGEAGAEIYSVATKKDQAKLVMKDAARMVGQSAGLRKWVKVYKTGMTCERLASLFQPLGRDSKSLDGLNPHMAIVDELHAWKGRELWDVIAGAFGSRRNWLLCAITTAGFNTSGICYERRRHCDKILNLPGVYVDEQTFAFIAAPDEGDDPFDPQTWLKANPNLGVSKYWDTMRGYAEAARQLPSNLAEFKALQLNIWVNAAKSWLDLAAWQKCAYAMPDEQLAGVECWGALDLAPVNDLSSLLLDFIHPSGRHVFRAHVWCPSDDIEERRRLHGVPYWAWLEAGFIKATEGNVTDFTVVGDDILKIVKHLNLKGLAYDPSFAAELAQRLAAEGVPMVPFRQGMLSMGPAVATLERNLKGGVIAHPDHPILNWCASNTVAKRDEHGNQKFIKPGDRHQKIDLMVCAAMAEGLWQLKKTAPPPQKGSVHF